MGFPNLNCASGKQMFSVNVHLTCISYIQLIWGNGYLQIYCFSIKVRETHFLKDLTNLFVFFFTSHSAPKHYHLAMHTFGLLTSAKSLCDLDDMLESAAVVFSSPSSGANVEKHFANLQSWLKRKGTQIEETVKSEINAEDLKVSTYYGFDGTEAFIKSNIQLLEITQGKISEVK